MDDRAGVEPAPLLRIAGLRVGYAGPSGWVPAVQGLDLDVAPGEAIGLVGASGSGKSTVIGAVLGLLGSRAHVRADELSFDGTDLLGRGAGGCRGRAAVEGTAYVPQQPGAALVPTVAIGRQLDWYLGPDAVARHAVALVDLGLDAVVGRPGDLPGSFSGGQLQRFVLAVATLGPKPRLLLADEPTSTLDTVTQDSVLALLGRLRSELGLAVLHVSHDLGVVASTCDRVGVLDQGRLVELAPVAQLFAAPAHPATRRLLAGAAPPAVRPGLDRAALVAPDPPVLEVDRLFHYYGRATAHGPASATVVRAVDEVSVAVDAGRVLAVVGASGSGKTTLVRAVAGAIAPTAGVIRLDGRELGRTRSGPDRRAVQLVGQHPWSSFNPRRTVGHGIDQAQRVHDLGPSREERRERAVAALARTGLAAGCLDRRPGQLSGGELARAVLARALVVEPRLLLLDEPTASLDAPVALAVLELLAELRSELDLTVLLVTHDLGAARMLADEVAVLAEGRLEELGPTRRVLSEPSSDAARALVAAEVDLPAAAPAG